MLEIGCRRDPPGGTEMQRDGQRWDRMLLPFGRFIRSGCHYDFHSRGFGLRGLSWTCTIGTGYPPSCLFPNWATRSATAVSASLDSAERAELDDIEDVSG